MYQIHPNARTTPAVRAAIATSAEPSGVLAKRYGVSSETIRKWRKRGPDDVQDHSLSVPAGYSVLPRFRHCWRNALGTCDGAALVGLKRV
ncbi:hypothetical protein [Azospirillum baldaniorum]|uniref:hypothetical protein n=1 Tax=Azospirillum baldaniorum TaxID=1064539 RepID=UPI003F73087A